MEDFTLIGPDLPDPFRLMIRESAHSTNDEVRVLAEAGAPHGLVILAQKQLAGRGRRGAAWFAPPGESLAFSILVRPQEPKAFWPRLALAAGLAVAEAIENYVPLAGIKWPNDLWLNGKKLGGILVEAGKDFAVVGIGLNLHTTEFPGEVAAIATSLKLETGAEISRPEVLAEIIRHFAHRHTQIGADFSEMLTGIRERCALTGHHVTLSTADGPRHGLIEGIGPSGELLLRDEKGVHALIQADEIRTVPHSSPS
ncbi:MAG: biotin--[acetyl-CoA-carboxylase] ligase [Luteolibacter sp.]